MAIFTAEQQAYLDGVHNILLDAIDVIDKQQSEMYFAIEGVKAILAFDKQLATMEELEGKAREMRVAADLMKLSDPNWIALEELRQRIKRAGDQGLQENEG